MFVRCASLLWLLSLVPWANSLQFEDWHCGAEEASRNISYQTIMEECPSFAVELNHCCVVHDDCYVKQFGQGKCDDDFCECNKRVLNRTGGQKCQSHASMVCILMPFFGMAAYEASVNYTEPEDLPKYIPNWPVLSTEYSTLYDDCPQVNSTIASCSIQLDECEYGIIECAEQLCYCLNNAYIVDNSTSCLSSTSNICSVVIRESHNLFSLRFRVRKSIVIIMSAFTMLCVVFLVGYGIMLRIRKISFASEFKYTAV